MATRIQRGPPPIDEAVLIGKALAEALTHAHAKGIAYEEIRALDVWIIGDATVKLTGFFRLATVMENRGQPGMKRRRMCLQENLLGSELVETIESGDLVCLGERGVVEHGVAKVLERAVEAHDALANVDELGSALAHGVHAEHA